MLTEVMTPLHCAHTFFLTKEYIIAGSTARTATLLSFIFTRLNFHNFRDVKNFAKLKSCKKKR